MRIVQYLSEDERDDLEDQTEELLLEKLEEYEYFEFTVINKIQVNGDEIDAVANGNPQGKPHPPSNFSLSLICSRLAWV